MPPKHKQAELPDKTWSVTEQDKEKIRDLGRKLTGFLLEHFKGEEHVPFKLIIGAFQYVADIQDQKTKALGEDFVIATNAIAQYGLSEQLEEPFGAIPQAPEETKEQKEARLKKLIDDTSAELAALEKGPVAPDADVEAASISPSSAPVGPIGG